MKQGEVTMPLWAYDRLSEMERQFKKHSIMELSSYGDMVYYYSRSAFDLKQQDKIHGLEKENSKLRVAIKKIEKDLEEEKKKYHVVDFSAQIKDMFVFDIFKLKFKGRK